jgi:hypothetical protein
MKQGQTLGSVPAASQRRYGCDWPMFIIQSTP